MTTTTEYALLAAASYFDTRVAINRIPAPASWIEIDRKPSDAGSGFEVAAFQRGSEIVISYAGTYDKSTVDKFAGAGLAMGFGSAQLLQAASPAVTWTT